MQATLTLVSAEPSSIVVHSAHYLAQSKTIYPQTTRVTAINLSHVRTWA